MILFHGTAKNLAGKKSIKITCKIPEYQAHYGYIYTTGLTCTDVPLEQITHPPLIMNW